MDWNLKNISEETPLLQAARGGYADSLQVILTVPQPYLDLTATNISGHSVTWLAVRAGNSVRCVQLLSDDPRVEWNSRDEAGDTPDPASRALNGAHRPIRLGPRRLPAAQARRSLPTAKLPTG